MFVIGVVNKSPGNDPHGFDVDLFYSFNWIDNLGVLGPDFWENGQKFMATIDSVSYAKLPIITEELIRKIESGLPKKQGRGDLLMFLIRNIDKKLVGASIKV